MAEVALGEGERLLVEDAGHDCVGEEVLPLGFIDQCREWMNRNEEMATKPMTGMVLLQSPAYFLPSWTEWCLNY